MKITTERIRARDEHVRESWVRAMEAKIVRDELNKCQRVEGVNHYENCRELSEKYLNLLKDNRVRPFCSVDTSQMLRGSPFAGERLQAYRHINTVLRLTL